jgi:hypothetical protein
MRLTADQRPADLPDYERPPIDEVAIGIQLATISSLAEVLMGR